MAFIANRQLQEVSVRALDQQAARITLRCKLHLMRVFFSAGQNSRSLNLEPLDPPVIVSHRPLIARDLLFSIAAGAIRIASRKVILKILTTIHAREYSFREPRRPRCTELIPTPNPRAVPPSSLPKITKNGRAKAHSPSHP